MSLSLDPIVHHGGPTGVLLLHGYTSGVPEMRPLADACIAAGHSVRAPLLPGHGTSPDDLNRRTWREVARHCEDELYALKSDCEQVFVAGLSMGGLLTLLLGIEHQSIAGLIPMATPVLISGHSHRALPLVRLFRDTLTKDPDPSLRIEDPASIPLLYRYEENPLHFASELVRLSRHVRAHLSRVSAPTLVVHGDRDQTVPLAAARRIVEEIHSPDRELLRLPRSGHCLSVDGERNVLADKLLTWIAERSSLSPPVT